MRSTCKRLAEMMKGNTLRMLFDRKKMLSYLWFENEMKKKEYQPKAVMWAMEERATALNDEIHKIMEESDTCSSLIHFSDGETNIIETKEEDGESSADLFTE